MDIQDLQKRLETLEKKLGENPQEEKKKEAEGIVFDYNAFGKILYKAFISTFSKGGLRSKEMAKVVDEVLQEEAPRNLMKSIIRNMISQISSEDVEVRDFSTEAIEAFEFFVKNRIVEIARKYSELPIFERIIEAELEKEIAEEDKGKVDLSNIVASPAYPDKDSYRNIVSASPPWEKDSQ